MSIDTVLSSSLGGMEVNARRPRAQAALVLMGGGARTAYQVGVLQALGVMLRQAGHTPQGFPFQILIGTSAGAINAACLAGYATEGLAAFDRLAHFWTQLHCDDIYQLNVPGWLRYLGRLSKVLPALAITRAAQRRGALLDNAPLARTLARGVSLAGIDAALAGGTLGTLAVTASSYSGGVHWTFCHSAFDALAKPWQRPGRRAAFQRLSIEHLMASSALPFIFPASTLEVDGEREHFGDGSMRQISPLSSAMHLGAKKILVVGASQPQRSGLAGTSAGERTDRPTLGGIAGHALASVFHDTVQADVEQVQRVTRTLRQLPPALAQALPYRQVEVQAIQPSQSLDALAQAHMHELPRAVQHTLRSIGAHEGSGAAVASYLLFEPGFVQALMALGEHDAFQRRDELLAFLQQCRPNANAAAAVSMTTGAVG